MHSGRGVAACLRQEHQPSIQRPLSVDAGLEAKPSRDHHGSRGGFAVYLNERSAMHEKTFVQTDWRGAAQGPQQTIWLLAGLRFLLPWGLPTLLWRLQAFLEEKPVEEA